MHLPDRLPASRLIALTDSHLTPAGKQKHCGNSNLNQSALWANLWMSRWMMTDTCGSGFILVILVAILTSGNTCYNRSRLVRILHEVQELALQVLYDRPGKVDPPSGKVVFNSHLPDGLKIRQNLWATYPKGKMEFTFFSSPGFIALLAVVSCKNISKAITQ